MPSSRCSARSKTPSAAPALLGIAAATRHADQGRPDRRAMTKARDLARPLLARTTTTRSARTSRPRTPTCPPTSARRAQPARPAGRRGPSAARSSSRPARSSPRRSAGGRRRAPDARCRTTRVAAAGREALRRPGIPPDRPRPSGRRRRTSIRKAVAAAPGDPYKGEPIFMQRCGVCHTLFYKGGNDRPEPDRVPARRPRHDAHQHPRPQRRDPRRVRQLHRHARRTAGRLSGFLADNDAAVVALRGFDGQDVRVPRDRSST